MLYYEITQPFKDRTHGIIEPGIYCKDMYVPNKRLVPGMIIYMAERIWVEQDGTIEYIKNIHNYSVTVTVPVPSRTLP